MSSSARRRVSRILALGAALILVAACVRPAEERTEEDLEVGIADRDGLAIQVDRGAAQVRAIGRDGLYLWAQAPVIGADLQVAPGTTAPAAVPVTVENCMPGAVLSARTAGGPLDVVGLTGERPTMCRFQVTLPPEGTVRLELAPPDAAVTERFRFAAMGDIQTGMPRVGDVFDRINREPGIRFVFSMGDLVEDGLLSEYDLLLEKLAGLDVPYFSTIGNHELQANLDRWHELFGRYNLHFTFKGAAFTLADSGNASLDPLVYDWLDEWLGQAAGSVHIFGTHYPPIDPVGARQGAFRSRKEATMLLARLAAGKVDLTIYGHIHSYYAWSNAGIPAYISGGGGALPEKLDGIGRHFLVVEVDPASGLGPVGVVRVDE